MHAEPVAVDRFDPVHVVGSDLDANSHALELPLSAEHYGHPGSESETLTDTGPVMAVLKSKVAFRSDSQ